jgi:hypothetical protein
VFERVVWVHVFTCVFCGYNIVCEFDSTDMEWR